MILQQLYQDAEAILGDNFAPPTYGFKPVRWEVCLKNDGSLIGIQSLGGDKDSKGGLPRLVPLPPPRSGTTVKACLLADSPAYVLGAALEEKEKRAQEKHTTFRALIQRCARETSDSSVEAVGTFLSNWQNEAAALPDKMAAGDLVSFRVGEERPAEHPVVQAFWANENSLEGAGPVTNAQCLVTGLHGPVERILQQKINGIPNGNPVGTALLTADKLAFESYGWQQARNSPISRVGAELSTKALNQLIRGERTNVRMPGLVYVFWTNQGGDEDVSWALDRPEQVRDALQAVWTGKQSRALQADAFYALALSASGGRAVVRDWLNTTVGHVYDSLKRWFEAQEIVTHEGARGPLLGVSQLAGAAYRDRKDMEPAVLQSLIRAALHGGPVPAHLLAKAVLRCRAEQRVTRPQAALIKACLATDPSFTEPEKERYRLMSQLDAHQTDPAYLCGRLLAELEVVQRAALGKTNTTLVDRYFGAASTAPATVFGVLLTNANKAHLPKLRKTRPAVYQALQQRLEEILAPGGPSGPGGMTHFPPTLTLREQGLFSLGFYHQRAADRKAAQEARERKDAALADLTSPDDGEDDATDEENGD